MRETLNIRIGNGFDVHKLVSNRDLILGGLKIPFEKGLLGHSDADVLIHSLMDAILGAMGIGDIGIHFSPKEKIYKNISSLILLEKVNKLVIKNDYAIINCDNTIIAEKPKLSSYIFEMRKNIARILEIDEMSVSIKATTTENLGFIGKGLGIATFSTVLLQRCNSKME